MTPEEQKLFEKTFTALKAAEAKADEDQAHITDLSRKLAATEQEVHRLREMIGTLAETTGRTAFRLEFGLTPAGQMQVTVSGRQGAEMEQARIASGVLAAFLCAEAGEPEDQGVAPEAPKDPTPTQQAKAELRRFVLGEDAP